MTFMQSFLKAMKEDFRHRGIAVLICCFLVFSQIVNFAFRNPFPENDYRSLFVGPGNITAFYMSCIMAFVCAFQGFSYLFSRKKTDFYFSLPVNRYGLLLAGSANSLILFAVPCILSRWICLQLAAFAGYTTVSISLSCVLLGMLITILGFFFLYQIMLLGMILAGTLYTGILMNILLLFGSEFVIGEVINRYCRSFFATFVSDPGMENALGYLAPLRLYQNACGVYSWLDTYEWEIEKVISYIWVMLFLTIVLFGLNVFLFIKRLGEAANRALAFEKTAPVIRTAIVVPAALEAGCLLRQASADGTNMLLMTAGLAAALFVCHGISECMFRLDLKGMLSHKGGWLAEGLLCLMVIGFFSFYKQYDTALPDPAALEAAAITIEGLNGAETMEGERIANAKNMDAGLMKGAVTGENADRLVSFLGEALSENQSEQGFATAYVNFVLKDGTREIRRFQIESKEKLMLFSEIYDTSEYKESVFSVLKRETIENKQLGWSNGVEEYRMDLTQDEKEELYTCYKKELTELSLTDLENEMPIGRLTLYSMKGIAEASGLIYPSFDRTITLLESFGFPAGRRISEYEIQEVVLQHYVHTDAITLSGTKKLALEKEEMITEGKKIEQLKDRLVYEPFAIEPLLHPVQEGLKAIVTLKGTKKGTVEMIVCLVA